MDEITGIFFGIIMQSLKEDTLKGLLETVVKENQKE